MTVTNLTEIVTDKRKSEVVDILHAELSYTDHSNKQRTPRTPRGATIYATIPFVLVH